MSVEVAPAPTRSSVSRKWDVLLRQTIVGRGAGRLFALLMALSALLYWPTLVELIRIWWTDPGYSHGFLVIPLAGWLGHRWFREHRPRFAPEPVLGTLETGAGVLLHWAALVVGWPLVDFVGLFFVLRGLTLAVHGRPFADGLTVPLAFLFFMFPLPGIVMASSALWLQDFVARTSGLVLEQFWVVRQRGHAIELPGLASPLVVGAECSGLRQLISLLAMSALLAHLGLKRWSSTIALMLITIPVAILANVARVIAMAVAAKWFGTAWLDTWLHSAPALFTFPIAIGLLLLFTWGLQRVEHLVGGQAGAEGERPNGPPTLRLSPLGVLGGTAVLFVGVAMQALLLWHLEAGAVRKGPRLPTPLEALPEQLARWKVGERVDLARLRERITFADDLLLRQYVDSETGMAANVYLVFSSAGKDREHHPEICMNEVAGMPDVKDRRCLVFINNAADRPVQRFEYPQRGERRLFVWYWHYTVEPPLREGQTILQALHQRLSRRPASLTVQVTALIPQEATETLERTLLGELDGYLRRAVLPDHAIMGCDRVQVHWLGPD